MTRARISVVVPLFNMARHLPDAISSVARQTVAVDEILIVDNNSTDGSGAVARDLARADPRIQVLFEPRQGAAPARNRGISAAGGEVVAFLDADDLWPQHKIARQLPRLLADDETDVVSGLATFAERLDPVALAADPSGRQLTYFHIVFGAGLYRRRVFDKVGLLDDALVYGEDGDHFLRILEAGCKVVMLQAVTILIRRDGQSLTAVDHDSQKRFFARIIGKSLARRRRADGSVAAAPALRLLFDAADAGAP